MAQFDREQVINLIVGTTGLFVIYLASGVFHEYLYLLLDAELLKSTRTSSPEVWKP